MQLIRPYTDQNNIPKTSPEELWISLHAYKHGAEIWSRAFFELNYSLNQHFANNFVRCTSLQKRKKISSRNGKKFFPKKGQK